MTTIFLRILVIFLMIFMGFVARKMRMLDAGATKSFAAILMNFVYPCLIFSVIIGNFTADSLLKNVTLPAGAFGIMLTGAGIGLLVRRCVVFRNVKEKRAFHFQCAINNYSFLPMPIAMLLWQEAGVGRLIFSTLGSELAVWTIGIFILTGHKADKSALKHLLSMPMIAIGSAILWVVFRDLLFTVPTEGGANGGLFADVVESVLWGAKVFGGATVPLAMVIAGSRMAALSGADIITGKQLFVCLLRLVFIPAVCIGWILLLPFGEQTEGVLLLVAIMPSAIAGVMLSELYNADASFAASSVLLTHLACLLTLPIWMMILFR